MISRRHFQNIPAENKLTVRITPRALHVIDSIADFFELKNTKGSGDRYALKFKSAIKIGKNEIIVHEIIHGSLLF